MTPEFVGLKEFRENMSKYSETGKKYIVLKRNIPIFEVTIIDNKKKISKKNFLNNLQEGLDQIKNGEFITHEELMEELGIK